MEWKSGISHSKIRSEGERGKRERDEVKSTFLEAKVLGEVRKYFFSDYFSGTKGLSVFKFVTEQIDHINVTISSLSYRTFVKISFKYQVFKGNFNIFYEKGSRVYRFISEGKGHKKENPSYVPC